MSVLPRSEGRSLFWPLVLIGVGLVWLLSNIGILQPASIGVLFRLWPIILIIIGLDLLFGRRSPALGTLIGVGGMALVIILMLVGPSLGWATAAELKEGSFNEVRGDANSATVILDLSVASTNVQALTDSNNLFEADLRYVGNISFNVTGSETNKTVSLSQESNQQSNFNFWDFGFFSSSDQDLHWNVGLNPEVPINLRVNGGVGSTTLDLNDLTLTGLDVNSGVGSLILSLPAAVTSYDVSIDGGVGSVTLDVPNDAAMRITVDTGLGGVSLPSNFDRVSGDSDNSGVWETSGYRSAEQQINIDYNGGVGSLTVN
jgi:hypothetical protein